MNVIARSSVAVNPAPRASGRAISARVTATTIREYRCSTRSMNSCLFALASEASSTWVATRASTESAAARSTCTVRAPVPFNVPARTCSPGPRRTGRGSPVSAAWSSSLSPDRTRPSAGTRSPGRTSTTSPTASCAAGTSRSVSSGSSRTARSGATSSSARTLAAVREVIAASSAPDVAKMTISSAPSKTCPIAAAASAATTIRTSTSSTRWRSACNPARPGSHPPAA